MITRSVFAMVAAVVTAALAGCASMEPTVPASAFYLSSPGMADNTMLDRKYAGNVAKNPNCLGQNVSPALAWRNVPDKTRSFVILWDDQAGRSGLGVSHSIVYGIPASVNAFAEGDLSAAPTAGRFVAGKNTVGLAWLGPCPPHGNAPQHYVMTIIATDLEPDALQPGLSREEVLKALQGGHALRAASAVFRYAH
ncbi:MAG: YbhB/YbcL family Raf kinase inhibitor-like protein [Candidatus Accumulibacter necessarius]|jgi:Raf kinase inhibitor-like YbhB/YbcL family protein|uniref:YbhB/YbcL family Raf kinase inhibitor-like protein n=1 Tax=Candidatus Accumulibacter necessarius TaxID=2954386 RepID=UPI002FC3CEB3